MPSYPIRALVLRKTKLGETDLIVTLLAEDGRQVRAVAKGARKPGSRLTGRVEPFVEFDALLHTGRSLDVVSEADIVRSHAALRQDLERSSAAAAVCDLLDRISLEGQGEPRLYGLAAATLRALETAETDRAMQVVTAFVLKAMAIHGYRPELSCCAECGGSVTGGRSFSYGSGGVVCPRCESDPCASMSEEGRRLLGQMLSATMAQVAEAEMPGRAVSDVLELLKGFVAYHLSARPKALEMYGRWGR